MATVVLCRGRGRGRMLSLMGCEGFVSAWKRSSGDARLGVTLLPPHDDEEAFCPLLLSLLCGEPALVGAAGTLHGSASGCV